MTAKGRRIIKNRKLKSAFREDPDHYVQISDESFNRFIEQEMRKEHCNPITCYGQCQGMSECDSARTSQIFQTYLDRNEGD